jgi:aspartyl-tRNA(Asn)/glutamyl-tRNA(Gln) amidotransferase subunit B
MPEQKKTMYCSTLDLSDYDAAQICNEKDDVLFFDELIKHTTHYKAAVNWFIGPIKYYCQENKIELSAFPLSKQQIAELIELTASGAVQFNIAAQKILPLMIANVQETALTIARQLNLIQEKNETALSVWIEEVLASMPEKVIEYKSGKKGLIGLFSGAIKKRSNGKADMQLVNQMLERYLNQ